MTISSWGHNPIKTYIVYFFDFISVSLKCTEIISVLLNCVDDYNN